MTILKSNLPEQSALNIANKEYDFIDSFVGVVDDENNSINSRKVGKAFFTSSPEWVDKLFILRNKIVSVFGLKTSGETTDRQKLLDNFTCEKGQQLGLFKVFSQTDNEVIIGEDDKHLNFRISLFIENHTTETTKKNLTISTVAEFNNWFGRLYFLPVKPFHKLIAPTMLKGIIKELEKNS
jgi:Protein of unknown function (DUF2867)